MSDLFINSYNILNDKLKESYNIKPIVKFDNSDNDAMSFLVLRYLQYNCEKGYIKNRIELISKYQDCIVVCNRNYSIMNMYQLDYFWVKTQFYFYKDTCNGVKYEFEMINDIADLIEKFQ